MGNNVSIATKPLVYSTFRYISNKVWNALAEYVDNAIQSYDNNKDILQRINPNEGRLRVTIDIDFDGDKIVIEDNAFGITEENYQRAFELANIPLDNKGLNEFGMGMKVSSIWLSNVWQVETTAFGDNKLKCVTFDLEDVVKKEEISLPVIETDCDEEAHFTRITLTHLSNNKPTSRQLTKIKKHLASIYTLQLRNKTLELLVNGEQLVYEELKVLKAPKYNAPKGEAIVWRKDIEYHFGEKYAVTGFIALLETMSTSTDNGFLLFRRGRVIGTSYEDRYRPKVLCGQEGSPQYKRVFGELHLKGFDVSFTKNSFQEDDDFAAFVEMLKEELSKDKELDLFSQAQNYTKPKTIKEIEEIGDKLITEIASGFTSTSPVKTESSALETGDESKEPRTTVIPVSTNETVSTAVVIEPTLKRIFESKTIDVKLDNNEVVELTINSGESSTGLYSIGEEGPNKYRTTINVKNRILNQFSESLSSKEGREQFAYFIKILFASELSLLKGGNMEATVFRNTFNKLFGSI